MANSNFFLPDWATGTTTSWCVGAQLRTKDGRRLGNAIIASYHQGELSPWEVITDAGTTLRLNEAELDELFWPPSWVMNVASSPGIRARTALAQPEPEGVTDEQWDAIKERLWDNYETFGNQGERFMYEGDFYDALDVARQDLTRFARPTIEPEGVTDDEIAKCLVAAGVDAMEGESDGTNRMYWEGWNEQILSGIRAVIAADRARFGTPTIEPVRGDERLPGPEDCDAEGRCWWESPKRTRIVFDMNPLDKEEVTTPPAYYLRKRHPLEDPNQRWLPHHALPLPQP